MIVASALAALCQGDNVPMAATISVISKATGWFDCGCASRRELNTDKPLCGFEIHSSYDLHGVRRCQAFQIVAQSSLPVGRPPGLEFFLEESWLVWD